MDALTRNDVTALFVGVGLLLLVTRLFGNWAERFRLPAVFGELLAGVVLGPTILGRISPGLGHFLFPESGAQTVVLDGLTTLGIAAFLLLAGLEIGLNEIRQQSWSIVTVSLGGFLIPFLIGIAVAGSFLSHKGASASPVVFTLFFATALSITALPVITKILKDLKLLHTKIGTIVVTAATMDDLTGWFLVATVLSLASAEKTSAWSILLVVASVLGFAAAMLTIGRFLLRKLLVRSQNNSSSRGTVLVGVLAFGCFSAAFTQWLGVHAILGAFLVGLALGDTHALKEEVLVDIERFIVMVLAPIFFGSIGLKVDFAAHFDPWLIVTVLLIACVGKLAGCRLGAWMGGIGTRDAWATGFAMNARGAMEIVVGLIALKAGIITADLFVALVIMAIATSLLAAVALNYVYRNARYPIPSEIAMEQIWAGN